MVFTTWADVLSQSFQSLFYGLVAFIPNLVIAIIIFIVGWLVGVGLGRVVKQVVDALRVDHALRSTGIERLLSRAGFGLSSGKFLGFLVEWFFIIVFLVAALDVLRLTTVNIFISEVVLGYLPQVIVAVLILLVAAVVSEAVERVVTGSAKAASLHAAGFLGKVARYAIWIFAFLAALAQLNVATAFVQTLFTGVVIAASLAIGLAFGLGGQASAARYLDRLQSEIRE
ncbi:MAG: Small-conductance mechanosensitive ion channel-like protein [Parcubacteria group bacterium GW2011_GWB1_57_6]|nr:MAG: Small-conductance mechanosensitive ion channel-like protein [Parcubacteria group bacterium GW2011_GWA1_56_13]KKW47069.1 MAG: Small-conductance mechanosensitive ion channel-like protein [Parcubacteria group bacterium GW2011_GWB1_57_6]